MTDACEMSISDKIKYYKRCNILKNLASLKFKNTKFMGLYQPASENYLLIIDEKHMTTIINTTTLPELERIIQKKLTDDYPEDCLLCCYKIDKVDRHNVSCTKCSTGICTECYINIFRVGMGVITCPFCKYTFGRVAPPHMVQLGILEIMETLRRKN
jgi:hypothetical protein